MTEQIACSGGLLNEFAINLFRQSGTSAESLCVSPTSVTLALAMIYYGASGETNQQIHEALFGSSLTDDQVKSCLTTLVSEMNKKDKSFILYVANRLFCMLGYQILQSYSKTIESNLGASIVPMNFLEATSAASEVNRWVAEKTRDKIKEIVSADSFSSSTRLVVLNAIYFEGHWVKAFEKNLTKKRKFYSSPTRSFEVDMMNLEHDFPYKETNEWQLLQLKYLPGYLSMNIFLPKEKFGLEKLEESFTSKKLEDLMNNVYEEKVNVTIPKFKLESDIKLKEALTAMGITRMFTEGADFSGISRSRDIFVSDAKHKTFIEVDEKGTKAAAVTALILEGGSLSFSPPQPVVFIADHPFIFAIVDERNRNILFIGRYAG